MQQHNAPDWIHVFVCINDRKGEKASCADHDAVEIAARLKAISKQRGWANRSVRVSKSGCLGLCAKGPNVVIHPPGIHFSHVTLADVPDIEEALARLVAERENS